MGKLKCPECGSDLQLTVDVVCEHSQKINNDGSLHKVKNISTRGNVNGAPYLQCTGHKCCFTYDVEHKQGFIDCAKDLDKIKRTAFISGIEAAKSIEWTKESEEIKRVLKEWGY